MGGSLVATFFDGGVGRFDVFDEVFFWRIRVLVGRLIPSGSLGSGGAFPLT